MTEVSWSLAFIAGVPFVGYLIDKFGWSAPFPIFTIFGLIIFFVVWRIIPADDHSYKTEQKESGGYRIVFSSFPALAGISIAMFATGGNELVNLIFGVWLENSFGLQIAALAGASAIIGLSEFGGEGLVALTTDRLGKPLSLTLGLIGNAAAALLLPFIGKTQTGALIGLFLFYITYEYVLVSHIPLVTELVPSARVTALSLNVTGHAIGRALGALIAGFIYQKFGFLSVALVAVIFNIFGLAALYLLQKGR